MEERTNNSVWSQLHSCFMSVSYQNWSTNKCVLVRYVTIHQDASVITLNDIVYTYESD